LELFKLLCKFLLVNQLNLIALYRILLLKLHPAHVLCILDNTILFGFIIILFIKTDFMWLQLLLINSHILLQILLILLIILLSNGHFLFELLDKLLAYLHLFYFLPTADLQMVRVILFEWLV